MLNIDEVPLFTRTATFQVPSGQGFDEQSCKVSFVALDIAEVQTFDLASPDSVKAFLTKVVVGLDEIIDRSGEPVRYSPEVRDRLIGKSWCRPALIEAYLTGIHKARTGN